jgi:hypothetical protein
MNSLEHCNKYPTPNLLISDFDLGSDSEDDSLDRVASLSLTLPPSDPTPDVSKPRAVASIGARVQVLAILEFGIPHYQITPLSSISKSALYRLRDKAILRGYDPLISKVIETRYVEDGDRAGRPKTSQAVVDLILQTLLQNSTTRGYSCQTIARIVSETPGTSKVSARTVCNVLTNQGYEFIRKNP